jgi:predicted benzoate:H+ symporter BenE
MTFHRYLILLGIKAKLVVAKAHMANAMENAKQKEAATMAFSTQASGGPLVGIQIVVAIRNVDITK